MPSPIFNGSVWKAGMEHAGSEKPGNWLQQFVFQSLCSCFFDPESCEAEGGGHLFHLFHPFPGQPLTLMNRALDHMTNPADGALLTAFISSSMGNVPVGSRFCATDPLHRMGSCQHQIGPAPQPPPWAAHLGHQGDGSPEIFQINLLNVHASVFFAGVGKICTGKPSF